MTSLSCQADPTVEIALGVVRPHGHHLVEVGQRGIEFALFAPDPATVKVGMRMLRIATQGMIEIRQGFLDLAGGLADAAAMKQGIAPGRVKSPGPC